MYSKNAAYWIQHLHLQPHPEGGYYKEVFRSKQQVLRHGADELKQACTSIYYLLEGADYSGFHRIKSDELWYFHKGEPLRIHIVDEHGVYSSVELSDNSSGVLSAVVEAGLWFASEIPSHIGFTLVSCAVAPGFEFSEFEIAEKQAMVLSYPEHEELFDRLCR